MSNSNDGRVPRAVGRVLRERERDIKAAKRLAKAASLPKPRVGPRKAS